MSDFPQQLTVMTEEKRTEACKHYDIIRPYLEGNCSQVKLARCSGVPIKTLQRWVQRYRAQGLCGLGRFPRSDRGTHPGMPPEERAFIEGLALQKPQRSKVMIHHQVCDVARERGWPEPSYRRLCRFVQRVSLGGSHEEVSAPMTTWQIDVASLSPVWGGEGSGEAARSPMLVLMYPYSRAIFGFTVLFDGRSVQTC